MHSGPARAAGRRFSHAARVASGRPGLFVLLAALGVRTFRHLLWGRFVQVLVVHRGRHVPGHLALQRKVMPPGSDISCSKRYQCRPDRRTTTPAQRYGSKTTMQLVTSCGYVTYARSRQRLCAVVLTSYRNGLPDPNLSVESCVQPGPPSFSR